jgi:hypothetical protein
MNKATGALALLSWYANPLLKPEVVGVRSSHTAHSRLVPLSTHPDSCTDTKWVAAGEFTRSQFRANLWRAWRQHGGSGSQPYHLTRAPCSSHTAVTRGGAANSDAPDDDDGAGCRTRRQ